jgi:hypothetical protein
VGTAVSSALPFKQNVPAFDDMEIAGSAMTVNVITLEVAVLQPEPAVQF